ncbi:MAG: Gfo/Idh/MocA family oxidoreductase [Planctomycetaceae bacterium]|nr:Gfo/Idh/MocA family oxidoreductase [Planctomycetaceae bacterium]
MSQSNTQPNSGRRQFLKQSGIVTAAVASLGIARSAHAAEDNTIRLALIGCGGRGTGAVADALSVQGEGPIALYAVADLDEVRMNAQLKGLTNKFADKINVSDDRKFLGFDAYRKAIDLLRPGDVAMCTTRAYIRPVHVEYAVQKGVNVFMEKPFSPDPGGLKRMLAAGEAAEKKNVKVAAGLQCRHSPARQALIDKIRSGEMGDIPLIRANRLGGRSRWMESQGDQSNVLLEQLKFGKINLFWIGSGHMVDNLIHQIDECCWIKDAWPVSAIGMGAREVGSTDCGQNLDTYAMEYTFPDGTKAFCGFRRQKDSRSDFATYIHGTKCAAQFSGNVHAATVRMFKDQRISEDHVSWTPTPDAFRPWQYEWNDFIHSIRTDRPHNEAKRACYADYVSLMGRAACHTGQEVTWDQVTSSDFQFCQYLDDLQTDSEVPVKADENGQFPVPVPGRWTEL